MLVDIFSSFDDNNQVFSSFYILMWLISLRAVMVFGSRYWVVRPKWISVIKNAKEVGSSQIFRSFGLKLGGLLNVVTALFLFIIISNLRGLIPYVFRSTSHLAVSLSLGLPLWFCLILSGLFSNPTSVVAGLLPIGAPAPLNPFLVVIETVRILVRPITLSVRLTANISAGHIVLTLIGSYLMARLFRGSITSPVFLGLVQVLYTIFEFGIGMIQAYIFCLLITLYRDEHPY